MDIEKLTKTDVTTLKVEDFAQITITHSPLIIKKFGFGD